MATKGPHERAVRFQAASLVLEGLLGLPPTQTPVPGVVVCHPHPLYGGDLSNNVVEAVCAALVGRGLAALRFNFRGVGQSQGEFDRGWGEQDDLRGALAFLAAQPEADPARLGVAGYSFGAAVALAVGAGAGRVGALCAISAPLDGPQLPKPEDWGPKAKLLVVGDADALVPLQALERWAATLPPPVELRSFEEVDHFWADAEEELAETVGEFFARSLGAPSLHSQSSI